MTWSHTADTDSGTLRSVRLTSDRFSDMEDLFDERRVTQRCFCMYWRRPDDGFPENRDNRDRFEDITSNGPPPGLLGYIGDQAVGWVQVGKRSSFPTLGRSRLFSPVDELDPWTINCFVVRPALRRKGVGKGLLAAAIEYAKSEGARVIEAYPVDGTRQAATDYFTGILPMFTEHGFAEVIRRNDTRPIVRLTI